MAKLVRKTVRVQKAWLKPSETPVELLKKLRKLLEKPERWTKGEYAKDTDGYRVGSCEKEAACFCLLGGIRRVVDGTEEEIEMKAAKALAKIALPKAASELEKNGVFYGSDVDYGSLLPTFNDAKKTKHRDVLKVIDKAIASLKASV